MATIEVGVASVGITPPPGLQLAGFAARTEPANGVHDPLTARALVIGDTALVVADVIGVDGLSSARIRQACGLPPENVVVAATHTHGAPSVMPRRLGNIGDPAFIQQFERGCIAAIRQAIENRRPATLRAGYGPDPGIARNRRHEDGPVDPSLPVLQAVDETGAVFAVLTAYACHPTVLGADNRLMTADYPYFVRKEIEAAYPGSVAIFAQGCSGDINIGHSAQASWTTAASGTRTFENAEHIGRTIGRAVCAAHLNPVQPVARAFEERVDLDLDRPETDLAAAAAAWRSEMAQEAVAPRALLLPHWIAWAEANIGVAPKPLEARVSLLDWGGVVLTAAPGELFVAAGLQIRGHCGDRPAFVLAYADDTPGYLPTESEYKFGGYEVSEAYRFFGLPGRFAPGSAERLVRKTMELLNKSAVV